MTDDAIDAALRAYYEDVPCYADTRTRLRAAIAAYEQAMWQPIEEAPKDGTEFLALNFRAAPVGYRVVYFDDQAEEPYIWHVDDAGKGFNHHRVFFTHYCPLPPPPGKEG